MSNIKRHFIFSKKEGDVSKNGLSLLDGPLAKVRTRIIYAFVIALLLVEKIVCACKQGAVGGHEEKVSHGAVYRLNNIGRGYSNCAKIIVDGVYVVIKILDKVGVLLVRTG